MSTDIGRCSPMPATLSQVMKLGRRTRADWPRVSGLLVMALILGSAGPAPSATSIPSPSNALWAELDIVPMPKRLRLTGKETVLDGTGGTALVVGTKPCRQTEIGVDWINRKLAERASSPLPVLKEGRTAPNGLSIVIGTRGDNELIDRAAATGLLDIGPGNPGKRGYEIRIARDGTLIYLAGADPVGALYACVTFAELIVKKRGAVVWRQAEVRDWPDFLHVPLGGMTGNTQAPEIGEFLYALKDVAPTPALRERYLKAYRAHFDRLLRWKISYLNYSGMSKYFRDSPPAASLALIREGIQYGKERGIGALVYGGKPFVGQAKDHPDVPIRCLALKKGWIRCWSMDDVRRQTAARFAGFVKAAGFTDVGFHDTDTGGYTNPARWNAR